MANKSPYQSLLTNKTSKKRVASTAHCYKSNLITKKRLPSSAYCYESHSALADFRTQEALLRKSGGNSDFMNTAIHHGSVKVIKIDAEGQVIPSSQRIGSN